MLGKILGVVITIIFSFLLFFVGMDTRVAGSPTQVYQVYLNGEKMALISDKDELLNLIDTEQSEIKEKYNVDKVYPPSGLDIKKIYTYEDDIIDTVSAYNKIKDIEPFTIEGYNATITYTEKKVTNDGETHEPAPPLHIYMLDKDIFEASLYNTAKSFIGTDELEEYQNNTQKEITDVGESISSVYFEETITIKKDLISTEEYVFSSVDELSRYLLYGTLEEQEKYAVREGEDLDTIADEHNLNIEELLIANPQFTAANVLLTPGEIINVGLISPLVSVVYRKTAVEDMEVAFKTEIVKDSTKYQDYSQVTTQGQNGVKRVTQDIKYVNGEIQSLNIVQSEDIKAAINQVEVRGTKALVGENYVYNSTQGNAEWSWPTISPFVITSKYKWRWGRQHQGIDISGCGYGSPIYAVKEGTVYYISQNKGASEGLSVYIEHPNGYVTQYMHLSKILVSVGQTVKREEKIGLMGCTGSCTGTHLHLGVWVGRPYYGGSVLDPCKSIFSC
ncbi:MAG: peptidoglycan DD-metalloendopeptidase family protein [Erysipelotrichales bacterium]|nr:peptidoglycan DD-metalloendopeptidase family protein [Erysipelotrichales bacterium]